MEKINIISNRKMMRCNSCESKRHLLAQCPHSWENIEIATKEGITDIDTVLLRMGETGQDENRKLEKIHEEYNIYKQVENAGKENRERGIETDGGSQVNAERGTGADEEVQTHADGVEVESTDENAHDDENLEKPETAMKGVA